MGPFLSLPFRQRLFGRSAIFSRAQAGWRQAHGAIADRGSYRVSGSVRDVKALPPGFRSVGGPVQRFDDAVSAIGTATDAIMSLQLPLDERKLLASHIAIADALTYVFGAFGVIWFTSFLAPKLLGIDLKKEAAALDAQFGVKTQTPGVDSAYRKYAVRAYR